MKSRLTYRLALTLAQYIRANKNQLQTEKPDYAAVVQRASEELGFACTEYDIRTIAEACECAWTPRDTEDISQDRVLQLLARAVVEIAEAIDATVDQDIHRIAHGRRVVGNERNTVRNRRS